MRKLTTSLCIMLWFTTQAFALGIGAAAPKFSLQTIEGKQVVLESLKGKVLVLKIGTTWCPGCEAQSRELQRVDDFMLSEGVTLVEVFINESAAVVKRYTKEHSMKTPAQVLLGDERFARDYGVYLIPRLLILGPDLKIIVDSGGLTAEEIKARLLQIKAGDHKK